MHISARGMTKSTRGRNIRWDLQSKKEKITKEITKEREREREKLCEKEYTSSINLEQQDRHITKISSRIGGMTENKKKKWWFNDLRHELSLRTSSSLVARRLDFSCLGDGSYSKMIEPEKCTFHYIELYLYHWIFCQVWGMQSNMNSNDWQIQLKTTHVWRTTSSSSSASFFFFFDARDAAWRRQHVANRWSIRWYPTPNTLRGDITTVLVDLHTNELASETIMESEILAFFNVSATSAGEAFCREAWW